MHLHGGHAHAHAHALTCARTYAARRCAHPLAAGRVRRSPLRASAARRCAHPPLAAGRVRPLAAERVLRLPPGVSAARRWACPPLAAGRVRCSPLRVIRRLPLRVSAAHGWACPLLAAGRVRRSLMCVSAAVRVYRRVSLYPPLSVSAAVLFPPMLASAAGPVRRQCVHTVRVRPSTHARTHARTLHTCTRGWFINAFSSLRFRT